MFWVLERERFKDEGDRIWYNILMGKLKKEINKYIVKWNVIELFKIIV